MERKIRMVLLENLSADDVLKLKSGGFFDGVQVALPQGVTGQEATLKVPTSPVVFPPVATVTPGVERVREVPVVLGEKLDPAEQSNTSESMKPVKVKKAKVEEPVVPTPAEVIQQTKEVEQEPVEEPKGNGKKLAAKNARQNARYVVTAFSKKWNATFIARGKGGLMFKLEGKEEPNVIGFEDGSIIEEVDAPEKMAEDEVAADDVDLSVDTLAGFTKLRDLLQYVVDCGIPAEGAAAFCEQMKESVPLLQRISNIEDRVQRTLEVMGLVK